MSIIITSQGKQANRIDKSSFENEKSLQQYIHANPESLPIYDIKENIRLLIVAREFQTSSGPIDAVGIDAEGDIYLVETKLYKNSDKRTVVAQVLDYGAALSKYSRDINQFLLLLEGQIKSHFKLSLPEKFKEYFAFESDEDYTEFLHNIKLNFEEGDFKFVVLMDKITDQLKDLITFINESSKFSIYTVLFDYYEYESFQIVIPKIIGVEASRKKDFTNSSYQRKKGTEEQFIQELNQNFKNEDLNAVMKLFEFGLSNADFVSWGPGSGEGVEFKPNNEKTSRRHLFRLNSSGKLIFWLVRNDVELHTKKYIEGIDRIIDKFSWEEFVSHPKSSSFKKYARLPFETWSGHVDGLIEELTRLIAK